jgi:hypothetical protein
MLVEISDWRFMRMTPNSGGSVESDTVAESALSQ